MAEGRRLLARNAELRTLWVGETVLKLGVSLRSIALPWLVMVLTGSPLQLGLSFALLKSPDVVFAPLIGYYIDRLPRKRLMLAGATFQALVLLILPVVSFFGELTIASVYGVMVLTSLGQAVYHNSREAILPTLVADEDLDEANSYFYMSSMILAIVFMLVGGVLTETVGSVPTLVVAAGALFVSVLPLAFVSETTAVERAESGVADFFAQLRAGLETIRGTVVKDVILFGVLINVATVPFALLITTISYDTFGVALVLSILLGAFRVGKLVGSYRVGVIGWPRERTFTIGTVAVGIAAIGVATLGPVLAAFPTAAHVAGLGVLLFLLGSFEPLFNVPADSIVQAAAPDAERGKVVTLTNAAYQLPFPVALLAGGYLAEHVSPFVVFAISGAIMVAVGVVAAFRFGVVGSADYAFDASA